MYSSKFLVVTSVAHQIEFYEVLGLRSRDINSIPIPSIAWNYTNNDLIFFLTCDCVILYRNNIFLPFIPNTYIYLETQVIYFLRNLKISTIFRLETTYQVEKNRKP